MAERFHRDILKNCPEWQRSLYTRGESSSAEEEQPECIFCLSYRKISPYIPTSYELKPSYNEDKFTVTYDSSFDLIVNSYILQTLPAIVVRPEWRELVEICWSENIGSNIFPLAEMTAGNEALPTIDSLACTIKNSLAERQGFQLHYKQLEGDLPYLTNWSSELPREEICVIHPFFYNMDAGKAFPLLYSQRGIGGATLITQTYTFVNDLGKLIRMRRRYKTADTGSFTEWEELKTIDYNYIHTEAKDYNLRQPIVEAVYGIMDEVSRELFMCLGKYVIHTTELIKGTSEPKECKTGDTNVVVNLDQTRLPIRALYWMAENKKARSVRSFSNFTTDFSNPKEGRNPCGKFTITKGKEDVLRKDASPLCSTKISQYLFDRTPSNTVGINSYNFNINPWSYDPDVAHVIHPRISLKVDIVENSLVSSVEKVKSIFEKISTDTTAPDKPTPTEYFLHTRFLVNRQIHFTRKTIKEDNRQYYEISLDPQIPYLKEAKLEDEA